MIRFSQFLWVVSAGVNVVLFIFLARALWTSGVIYHPVLMTAEKDLALGADLPSSLRPFLDSRKPLLVVAFGQCSECAVKDLSGWAVMLDRWGDEVKGVIVAKESQANLKAIWGKYRWKVPFVADESEQILKELNAYFLPRAYGFSPEGKLVWKQDSIPVNSLEAIRIVVEAIKGKDYAKKVFDRKPKWAEALEKGAKGKAKNSASRIHHSTQIGR